MENKRAGISRRIYFCQRFCYCDDFHKVYTGCECWFCVYTIVVFNVSILAKHQFGLDSRKRPILPTHPLTQYFALKREVSVTVNFGSGEG